MRLFLKRSRGSMTVMVALIMVPTIFFTSFLVDLARIKLYSNQAVMVADNYGQTVMTYYDNVLKELYGLFSVTQNDVALRQLDVLQGYMTSSFYPNAQQIEWEHLKDTRHYVGNKMGKSGAYSGFMPYRDAELTIDYKPVEGANLGNNLIFSSQVGDFMKFRIVQCIGDDGSKVIEAIEAVQKTQKNAEAIEKRQEIGEQAEKFFEKAKEYYEELKKFKMFRQYLEDVNDSITDFKTTYQELIESEEYLSYVAVYNLKTVDGTKDGFTVGKEASDAVAEYEEAMKNWKGAPDPKPEEPDDDTKEKAGIYDKWVELKPDSTKEKLENKYSSAAMAIETKAHAGDLTIYNYVDVHFSLLNKEKALKTEYDKMAELRKEMDALLQDTTVSDSIKNGIKKDLETIDEISSQLDTIERLDIFLDGANRSAVDRYKEKMDKFFDNLVDYRDIYFVNAAADKEMEYYDFDNSKTINLLENCWLILDDYDYFMYDTKFKKAYESLEKCFENYSDAAAERSKAKREEADKELQNSKEELKEDDNVSGLRDIPEAFGYGSAAKEDNDKEFDIGAVKKMFTKAGLEQKGEELLLKFYTVEYDFGMFSDRVTPVKKNNAGEVEVKESLTGYEMSQRINYLYGAELEYVLNGSNSSNDNLKSAKYKILGFRMIMNFATTYQIQQVNESIQIISDAAAAVNPALGLVVNGALRLGVAGIETAADWKELKEGNEVYVVKSKLEELTAYNSFKGLIDSSADVSPADTGELKMDYENYVMVMMLFFTSMSDLTQRTENLVELNVNNVEQNGGVVKDLEKLEFKMSDAVTAVNASCAVHMNFLVMPDNFAKSAASEDTYDALKEFEKNSYKFTVTRSY